MYESILKTFKAIQENEKKEVRIVKTFVEQIKNKDFGKNVILNTGFCHQKPYAFLVNPVSLFGKSKTELGDLLFVIKYKENGRIVDYRAMFYQVKHADKNYFPIELHQFHFYAEISKIVFRFGNTVYKKNKMQTINWNNLSSKDNFGAYLLLSNNHNYDVSINELAKQYHAKGHNFTFELPKHFYLIDCHIRHLELNKLGDYLYSFKRENPLLEFIQPFGIGQKVENTYKSFLELIYKKLEMIPDPPEEHETYWEDDKQGFGIVDITVKLNKDHD